MGMIDICSYAVEEWELYIIGFGSLSPALTANHSALAINLIIVSLFWCSVC